MNPFSSRITKTIDVPFDPPNTATIRKLSGRHLARAGTAFFNDLIAGVRERGGASVQKDIEQLFKRDPKQAAEDVATVKADPLNGYDKHTVCAKGIVSWSYDLSLIPVPPVLDDHGNVVTPEHIEAIEDLHEEALDFFAREIMQLTKPTLFQSKDEQEEARKNA